MTPQTDPVLREYTRLARRYDARWAYYVAASIKETLKRLPLTPTQSVLDVGCGTGALLAVLGGRFPEATLTGIDPTLEMLRMARPKLACGVRLLCAWAEQLPFPQASFDLVVSTSSFHYFRQPQLSLQEIHRVLKPNGSVVITDWCDDYLSCKLCDLALRMVNSAHGRTYGIAECKRLLEAGSFEGVAVESYKINWLWGLMTAHGRKGTTLDAQCRQRTR